MTSIEENGALAPVAEVQEISDEKSPQPSFADFGLAPELLAAIADLGYTTPTTVQQRCIGLALPGETRAGSDLMVGSQTGSGKTAAFLLPVLNMLLAERREEAMREQAAWQEQVAEALARGEPAPKKPRRRSPMNARRFKPAMPGALVLAPTRELAQQVARDAIDLVKHCSGLRIAHVMGGVPYRQQIAQLQNASLVVATPGRLLDLASSKQIMLDQVRTLVVDEADRMLDLGFADALAEIHQLTAGRRQTMMFSATFAAPIQKLAMRVMPEGGAGVERIQVTTPAEGHANIRQELYWADSPAHKRQLLDHWLRDPSINQALVFACTQVECEELAYDLRQEGFAASSLHGALNQSLRNRRLKALRDGKMQILVATDVAARGIDVPTITHVFNYGLPMKAEDYTHRIGRTGRAGREGLAVTLAEFRDRRRLAAIESHTRQPFEPLVIAGMEPQKHFPAITDPRQARRRAGPGRGKPTGRKAPHRHASADFSARPARSGFKAKPASAAHRPGAPRHHAKPGARGSASRGREYTPAG